MAEELKPCPFCGGEPNLTHSDYVHDDLRPMPVVECKSCSAWVRAEDWNRRAQLPSQGGEPDAELVELLEAGRLAIIREIVKWSNAACAGLPVNVRKESELLARIDAKLSSLEVKP